MSRDMYDLAVYLTDTTPKSQLQLHNALEETFEVNFPMFCHLANAVLYACLPSSRLNEDQGIDARISLPPMGG